MLQVRVRDQWLFSFTFKKGSIVCTGWLCPGLLEVSLKISDVGNLENIWKMYAREIQNSVDSTHIRRACHTL